MAGQEEIKQTVEIPTAKVSLQGELIVPAKAPGIVVFAHGSGSSRFSPRNQAVAAIIRQAGIGTLLFDLLTADEEAVDIATAFVVVLALLLLCANSQPENRPTLKMRASTSVRSMIAPGRPRRFRGGIGGEAIGPGA